MTPRKRICCAVETCSLARCALTVKDSVQCSRDTVVESLISLILESCKHAKSSVGDKLKVVQFHPVIRSSVNSITQNNKLRLAPTRCSLDSQYVHIRCSLPVKNTKTGSANKRLASIAVFSGFASRHQSYSHCP